MDRKTFAFSCVVNIEKIDKIFKIFKEGKYIFANVQFFTCYVEQEYNDPGTRQLKGMVQFDDDERWFNSAIGNMLWWRYLLYKSQMLISIIPTLSNNEQK